MKCPICGGQTAVVGSESFFDRTVHHLSCGHDADTSVTYAPLDQTTAPVEEQEAAPAFEAAEALPLADVLDVAPEPEPVTGGKK